jgi:hypothetical protein
MKINYLRWCLIFWILVNVRKLLHRLMLKFFDIYKCWEIIFHGLILVNNDKKNCIVNVSISRVESLFSRWYDTCSCYMHIGHEFMNISFPPHIFCACWVALPNRVMLQFGFKQHISSDIDTSDQLHFISCSGMYVDYNWMIHHL